MNYVYSAVHYTALAIGYAVLVWFALKGLYLIYTFPRIFPKSSKSATYTRYVYIALPWLETKVWQHVWRGLYLRVPESWAKTYTFNSEQKEIERRVYVQLGEAGIDPVIWKKRQVIDHNTWFKAARVLAAKTGGDPWRITDKIRREIHVEREVTVGNS